MPAALLQTVQGVGLVGNGGGMAMAEENEADARSKHKTGYEVGHPLRFKPSSAKENKAAANQGIKRPRKYNRKNNTDPPFLLL